MKKITGAAALIIAGAVTLAACSNTPTSTTGSPDQTGSGSSDVKVAFVSQVEGIPYFNGFKTGGERAAADLSITYTQTGPAKADSTEQVKILDGLVSQQYDAIAVSPLDPTSINSSLSAAASAGVKIATSDADAPESERAVFVSQASDEALGSTVMDELAKAMDGTGQFGIVSGSADTATFNNWIAAAQAQQEAEYPDMELVGGIRYTTDTAQALQEAQNLMTAFPDLKGIIAVPSTAIPGVAQAVQNGDAIGRVAVTGFGSPQTSGEFLESGAMTSTVLWDVEDLGYLTVWALNQLVTETPFEATNEVPGLDQPVSYDEATKTLLLGEPTVFTKDNYADYDF
ncbi:rhamnose transport system substrate-binding protein [Micrococcales bacterium KH10]|nr:rhamnose transport system substrate-binding protein [Micrococcales bacterium KH10]